MFSHIMVGTDSIEVSKNFYDTILGVLGYAPGMIDDRGRCFYVSETGIFALTHPIDGGSANPANGGTIGFVAGSIEDVDSWHRIGLEQGGRQCEDPPGIRENAFGQLYVAYLRDPFGNKICAVCRQM